MKTDVSHEQRLIAEIDSFEFVAQDIEGILQALDDWLARLSADLQDGLLTCAGFKAQSALVRQAEAINAAVRNGMHGWSRQRASMQAVHALADTFDDKLVLLVFGKFNAGKSSLCNLLADRFAAHGRTVEYFHLESGHIVETAERFKEGATETTARLQGVRLGAKLVLLDTPGLHSVTPENAALTQRFTESADGVLWLTSSTSPGQVQELDELGRELHRNKPLLPVLTRSDMYEEDEVDGEIRKCLRNKTAANRAEQEADIKVRAQQKLVAMGVDPALLGAPVSTSALMARQAGQMPAAMTEAGFEKLYAALLAIAEPTLVYKRRKVAEIVLHHLEEQVLGMLRREVLPLLAELKAALQAALDRGVQRQERIARAVWRAVIPALPALLERHAATRDVGAICQSLSQSMLEAFSYEAGEQLADHGVVPAAPLAQIELAAGADFENIVVEAAQAGGGSVGQLAGVEYGRLYAAIETAVRHSLLRLCDDAAEQCRVSTRRVMDQAGRLEDALERHERDLFDLKGDLRREAT